MYTHINKRIKIHKCTQTCIHTLLLCTASGEGVILPSAETTRESVCVCVYIYMRVCVSMHMCICMCQLYIYIYIYMYIYMHVCVSMHMCICICQLAAHDPAVVIDF